MPEPFELDMLDLPEDSEIHRLLVRCEGIEALRFLDGDNLMVEGEDSRETYIVLRGSFVVEQGADGENVGSGMPLAIRSVTEDDPLFIGEMAYLGDSIRTATVRSSGAVFTLCLRPEHIDTIIEEFPFFTRVLSRQLTRRVRESGELIKSYQEKFDMNTAQVHMQAGDEIASAGDAADCLYQLLDGTLTKDGPQGVETITSGKYPLDMINAAEFLSRTPYPGPIRAKTKALLVAIDKSSRMAIIRNYPQLASHYLKK
jgi:CRP-like cAMP-binding protein